jgi:hypothetical protein
VFLADALVDLGEVLRAAGRTTDARTALREAMDLYAAKGSLACLERARDVLGDAMAGASAG